MYKITLTNYDWKWHYNTMNEVIRNNPQQQMIFVKTKDHYKDYQKNWNNKDYVSPIKIIEDGENSKNSIKKDHYDALRKRYKDLTDNNNNTIHTYVKDMYKYAQFNPGLELCPFCSLEMAKFTIEHRFPKSIYPEYILYPLNLVPCCSNCNINGFNFNFHPYFDETSPIFEYSYEIANNSCKVFVKYADNELVKSFKKWEDGYTRVGRKHEYYVNRYTGARKILEVLPQIKYEINTHKLKYGEKNWIVCLFKFLEELEEYILKHAEKSIPITFTYTGEAQKLKDVD